MDHVRFGRRRLLQGTAIAASSVAAGTLPRTVAQASSGPADLVLHGGQVLVMDRAFTIAEAVAVRAGRVVHAGDDHSMRRLIGRRTEVINLRGRTVLPGINDSHLHGLRTGLSLPPYNLNVGESAVKSIVDIAGVVAAAVAPGAWIRGKGWNETKLADVHDRGGLAGPRGPLEGLARARDGGRRVCPGPPPARRAGPARGGPARDLGPASGFDHGRRSGCP